MKAKAAVTLELKKQAKQTKSVYMARTAMLTLFYDAV